MCRACPPVLTVADGGIRPNFDDGFFFPFFFLRKINILVGYLVVSGGDVD